VLFRVYQGEHADVRKNQLVGTFRLDNLPPRRAGDVNFSVRFGVDANGILEVSAKDVSTGQTKTLQVRDTMRLSEAEMQRLQESLETA
jgi:L1 cell adhesion molecule like protein